MIEYIKYIKKLLYQNIKTNTGNTIIKGTSSAFTIQILGYLLLFLLNLVLTRILTTQQYGNYIFVWNWIRILSIFGSFGMVVTFTKYISIYSNNEEYGNLKGLILRGHQIVAISSIIIFLLLKFLINTSIININKNLEQTFTIGLIGLIFFTQCSVVAGGLQGQKKILKSKLLGNVLHPLIIIILVLSTNFLLGIKLNATKVMFINLISTIFGLIIGFYWFIKFLKLKNIINIPPIFITKTWIKSSFYFMLLTGVYILMKRIDIIMVGSLIDTIEAGIYNISVKVTIFTTIVFTSISAILTPIVAELYSQKQYAKLQKILSISTVVASIFIVVISFFVFNWGDLVLQIFGKDYTQGFHILQILIVGQILNALTGYGGELLKMSGKHRPALIFVIISLIINALLNYLLINIYGAIGAAISTTISLLLLKILFWIYSIKVLKIDPSIISLVNKY